MSEVWHPFFKPSVRSSGLRLLNENRVSLSQPSDTEIVAYVKASSGFKVTLKLASMASHTIIADCTCPAFKKEQFCKHIWAAFLKASDESPDFFENKNNVQLKMSHLSGSKSEPKIQSAERLASQAAFKAKQDDYRKQQYQKQKARAQEFKKARKAGPAPVSLPANVEMALAYFTKNGFNFAESLDENAIYIARKKLSRIFHPDVGGSHQESLELNNNSDVLLKYISSKN
jgi:hypothetical protein